MQKKIDNRNAGIDLLRCLSVVYIVGFWHMLDYASVTPLYHNILTYRITWIVLATFIFISGYYIGRSGVSLNRKSLLGFYKKRLLRIYPLYSLAIAVFTLSGLSDNATSLKALFAVSMLAKPAPPTLWFITMLLLFYAISPFLIVLYKKYDVSHIIVLYVILAILLLFYESHWKNLDVRFLTYLPAFIFGQLVAIKGKSYFYNKTTFGALIFGAFVSFFTNSELIWMNWLLATLMVTATSFYLFICFEKINFFSRKAGKFITLLSYASYCMYLFHRPIYMYIGKIYFPASQSLQLIYLMTICLPCILLLSYLVQSIYDKMICFFIGAMGFADLRG